MIPNPSQDSDTEKAIKSNFTCSRVCLETLQYCLNQKAMKFSGPHLAGLQFCSDACLLSARMMMANHSVHHQSCELSYELCTVCAEECERHQDDPMMARCAEECRRCAEICKSMVGMSVDVRSPEGKHEKTTRP